MFHAFVTRRGALRAALGGAGHVPPAACAAAPARAPPPAPPETPAAEVCVAPRVRLCGRRAPLLRPQPPAPS